MKTVYCELGNFRVDIIPRRFATREMVKSLCRLLMYVDHALVVENCLLTLFAKIKILAKIPELTVSTYALMLERLEKWF